MKFSRDSAAGVFKFRGLAILLESQEQTWISEFSTGYNSFFGFRAIFSLIFDARKLYTATRDVILSLSCLFCSFAVLMLKVVDNNSKLPKSVILYDIWTGRDRQSTLDLVYFLAGDGLVYGCNQIFPETTKAIRFVAVVKRRVVMSVS